MLRRAVRWGGMLSLPSPQGRSPSRRWLLSTTNLHSKSTWTRACCCRWEAAQGWGGQLLAGWLCQWGESRAVLQRVCQQLLLASETGSSLLSLFLCVPQNFFLYFYGMCFNLVGLSLFMLAGALTPATMFAGFRQVGGQLYAERVAGGALGSSLCLCV